MPSPTGGIRGSLTLFSFLHCAFDFGLPTWSVLSLLYLVNSWLTELSGPGLQALSSSTALRLL